MVVGDFSPENYDQVAWDSLVEEVEPCQAGDRGRDHVEERLFWVAHVGPERYVVLVQIRPRDKAHLH